MGAKGEAFAKQFEAKVEEATTLLEKLTDADWKKTTATEKWTIAVTAHHIASSYEPATHIIKTIAAGQANPTLVLTDAVSVFWLSTGGSSGNTVMRLAK